jgi:hypothetical protein
MSAGPREQTTEVLKAHVWDENQCRCSCGERDEGGTRQFDYTEDQWAAHAANAVVEALGLTEERGVKFNHAEQVIILKDDAQYDDYGRNWSPLKRWVSGWSVVGGDQ